MATTEQEELLGEDGMSRHASYILVMGVSGVGKTTIARAMADVLHGRMIDADDYHPEENIAAMRAGVPLTDKMRAGWLDAVAAGAIAVAATDGGPVAIACSALKASYRDRLRAALGEMFVVYLHGTREAIRPRMAARKDHYMPPSLLDSQFAALEPPVGEPDAGIELDVAENVDRLVQAACDAYRLAYGPDDEDPTATPGEAGAPHKP